MSKKRYTIKPLNWLEDDVHSVAYTPFDLNYRVRIEANGVWHYRLHTANLPCESREEGKRKSEENWIERMEKCLEVTND